MLINVLDLRTKVPTVIIYTKHLTKAECKLENSSS